MREYRSIAMGIVLFLTAAATVHPQTATLTMPDKSVYSAGETVVIPVKVGSIVSSGGTGGISGFLLSIHYDQTCLTYQGYQGLHPGAGPAYFKQALVTTGSSYNWRGIWVNESLLTTFQAAPGETLVELVFTYNGPAEATDLTWSSSYAVSGGLTVEVATEMTDENYVPYSLTLDDGQVSLALHPVLDLTVFLEGPYMGSSTMDTDLLDGGQIPVGQPYDPALPYYGNNAPVWLYPGTESAAPVPAGVVDWVLVQLRDAVNAAGATPATIVAMQAGFLLGDGTVVGVDGVSNLYFPDAVIVNNLFVVIYHRNHLGIMSANPLLPAGGVFSYDFSTGAGQVYGGAGGHKEIGPGVWGMAAGDGNADGLVDITDIDQPWSSLAGEQGYIPADHDLDVQADNRDKDDVLIPNLGRSSQVPQ